MCEMWEWWEGKKASSRSVCTSYCTEEIPPYGVIPTWHQRSNRGTGGHLASGKPDKPEVSNMAEYGTATLKANAHDDGVWSVAWTAQGQILSGSVDGTLKVWQPTLTPAENHLSDPINGTGVSLSPQRSFPGHHLGVVSVVASSSGDWCAASSVGGSVSFWSLDAMPPPGTPKPYATLHTGPGDAWQLALPPKHENILLASTKSGGIAIFDTPMATSSINHGGGTILPSTPKALLQPTLSSSSSQPAAGGGGGGASSTGASSTAFMMCVAAGGGGVCAGGGDDGSVSVFDMGSETMTSRFDEANGHGLGVRSLCFASSGGEGSHQLVVSGGDDMVVKVWDQRMKSAVASMSGHNSWVCGLSPSPDGRHFASCSSDRTVRVWDLGMRECVHVYAGYSDQVCGVAYSPSGSHLVGGCDDGSVGVHDTPIGGDARRAATALKQKEKAAQAKKEEDENKAAEKKGLEMLVSDSSFGVGD